MQHNPEGGEQKGNKAELLARVKNMESAKVVMATSETNKNPNPNPRGEALPSLTDFKGRKKHFPPLHEFLEDFTQAMLRCC
jgi:hypothetical protein